jgi:hypothetical protein
VSKRNPGCKKCVHVRRNWLEVIFDETRDGLYCGHKPKIEYSSASGPYNVYEDCSSKNLHCDCRFFKPKPPRLTKLPCLR